jgi:hypothetical protein
MTLIYVEMSANAARSRVGRFPNPNLDAALTPTGTVYFLEMKDWKQMTAI